MSGLIASLEQRLKAKPDDFDGWLLLANSHLVNQQLPQAQAAFTQAHRLSPEDTGITLSLVDAMVTQNNGLFSADADVLLAQVIALEPDNALALWFSGLSAQQKGNSTQAAEIFRKLKRVLPKDAPSTQRILEKLDQLTH
jgi:cytochrome c-type biogenesis protein CcmH